MSAPFQVMPALTDDEFQELRDDIAANGITVPVVVDQHGRVIDGHHRLQIAGLLGIDPADVPRVVREVVNAQEARSLAYSLNLHRRHLDREARRALLAASIKADPGLSDRQHAGRAGVSDKTATAVRRDLESTAEIPQLTKRTGADGKQRTMPAPRHVDTTTGEITETAGAGEAPTRAGFTEDTPPAPATVTGLDGKTYTRGPQRAPKDVARRPPLTEQARTAGWDLHRVVARVARIAEDDRLSRNKDEVAAQMRSHLVHAVEVCQDLLDRIDNNH